MRRAVRALVILAAAAACRDAGSPNAPARGVAARITFAPISPSATVGVTVPVSVRVVDAFDSAVANASIQLSATGGGTLPAPAVITDATGNANALWTLGTARGANVLTAKSGAATASATVVAQADVATTLVLESSTPLTAPAGEALPSPPRLRLLDRYANGVSNETATFAVTAGGGSLMGSLTARSDTNGIVTAPSWVLGKRKVPQEMRVTVGSLARMVDASIASSFELELRFVDVLPNEQRAVFEGAASRVRALVTKGGPPIMANNFPLALACGLNGMPPLNELVAGIVIYVRVAPIDGPSKIFAQTGPCGFRDEADRNLPVLATIHVDDADVGALIANGLLEDLITHEMFHAIGFGALWEKGVHVTGTPTVDPRYVGANGRTGCARIAPESVCSPSIPLENMGGPGTIGTHWRESVFRNELLTGYLVPGSNPLSVMSIASLVDLGYAVSLAAADSYAMAAAASPSLVPRAEWEHVHGLDGSDRLERVGGLMMPVRRR